ncbi:MAG: hypothetical protein FJ216_01060 [Ignavibacteria bacterium]|nr:hypothetical protein [Ignavibacteria bacterium]
MKHLIIPVLLAIFLSFSLISCSKDDSTTSSQSSVNIVRAASLNDTFRLEFEISGTTNSQTYLYDLFFATNSFYVRPSISTFSNGQITMNVLRDTVILYSRIYNGLISLPDSAFGNPNKVNFIFNNCAGKGNINLEAK